MQRTKENPHNHNGEIAACQSLIETNNNRINRLEELKTAIITTNESVANAESKLCQMLLNAQMHDGLDGQTQNLMIPDCGDLSYNDLILLGIVYGPLNPNEKSKEETWINDFIKENEYYYSPYIEITDETIFIKNQKDIGILAADTTAKFGYLTYENEKYKINYDLREKNGTYIDPLYQAYAKGTNFYRGYDLLQFGMNIGNLEDTRPIDIVAGGIQNTYINTTLYEYNNQKLANITFDIKTAQKMTNDPIDTNDEFVSEQTLYSGNIYIDSSGKYRVLNPKSDVEAKKAENILGKLGE